MRKILIRKVTGVIVELRAIAMPFYREPYAIL